MVHLNVLSCLITTLYHKGTGIGFNMTGGYCFSITLLLSFIAVHCQDFQWTPYPNDTHSNFQCDASCRECHNGGCSIDDCCVCKVLSEWERNPQTIHPLHVEYKDVFGGSSIAQPLTSLSDGTKLEVVHRNGRLRSFPNNFCSFERIVHIDFQTNKIEKIPNLSCIPFLEVLDLKHNALVEVRNTTFINNTLLRKIDLSFNGIRVLDPNAFRRFDGSTPLSINLAGSHIKDFDVTNMLFENQMLCDIDLSSSSTERFVNLNNFKVAPNSKYSSYGFVNFENSMIEQLPNLTSIGIYNGKDLYEKLDFRVSVRNVKLTCDCIYANYLKSDFSLIKKFFLGLEIDTLICTEPEALRNHTIREIMDKDLDEMICNVIHSCPYHCQCFEQPSRKHTVINCTDSNVTSLPSNLPWSDNYSLILGDNQISSLEPRSYLGKVSYLQISGLNQLDGSLIRALPDDVSLDISDHKLHDLPMELLSKNPLRINLGRVQIECTCSSKWIYLWTHFEKGNSTTEYMCSNFNKRLALLSVDDFGCTKSTDRTLFIVMVVISVLAVLLILGALSFCCWYPEMLILTRKLLTKSQPNKKKCEFDVFISIDENDNIHREWVMKSLLPYLESEGYRVFLPLRDVLPGDNILAERATAMRQSIAFIVILTEKDSMENFQDIEGKETMDVSVIREFEVMWNLFVKSRYRNIIVLDYENIRWKFTAHRIVKAFVRMRHFIKVSSRKKNVLREIRKRLHDPFEIKIFETRDSFDFNGKKKFNTKFLESVY